MTVAIKIENLSKQYRLGLVSTRTLSHDLNRWWQTAIRGKEDPYLKIGEVNDRATRGEGEYVWALRDINLEVEQGEVLGIIGKNGAGKSTLLKILSKVTAPTTGTIKTKGRIASLLEVGTGFHYEMTGRENIYMNGAIMGMSKAEINRKLDEIIDFAGVERYIDTPVKRYSSGMIVRLGFAVAAHLEPEILVVDEVLAVGDAEFQKKAIGKMQDISKGHGRTVLFVSHNMEAIKSLCPTSILLEKGIIIFNDITENVLHKYFFNLKGIHYVKFKDPIVKEAKISQVDNDLFLEVKYVPDRINVPNLGFVIFNELDIPIIGGNQYTSDQQPKQSNKIHIGIIKVKIVNPRLKDGQYSVSIWFGNKQQDFFIARHCIFIIIKGMVKLKYANTSFIGSIAPTLEWTVI